MFPSSLPHFPFPSSLPSFLPSILPLPLPFSPLLLPPPISSQCRDPHKVQEARLLESVKVEKNVMGVGGRKNMIKN